MTVNVNIRAVELAEDLAGYISAIRAKKSKSKPQPYHSELIEAGQFGDFSLQVLEDKSILINQDNDTDVEGCFNVLCALITRVENAVERESIVQKFIAAIADSTDDKALMRLKVLTNLYNLLPDGQERFEVLIASFEYAVATGNSHLLASYVPKVGEWVQTWNLSKEDTRKLYHLLFKAFQNDEKSSIGQEYLIKYLKSFEGASPEELAKVKKEAAEGAVAVIRRPIEIYARHDSVINYAVVAQLENDSQYADLFQLLRISSLEKLDAYLSFYKSKGSVIEKFGLNHEDNVKHMRLLSLCSLASENSEISYSNIAETLHIELEDVENWVVEGITSELINAKMDQLRQIVTVRWYATRVFDDKQWNALADKLATWKTNVKSLLQAIDDSKSRRP